MGVIPESEIHLEFVRSSGPGGQNVNKTSTKVQLRWSVMDSAVFTIEQKLLIRSKLAHRITQDGYVALDVSEERSQLQNKQRALELLYELVAGALEPKIPRVRTKPTRAARLQRLSTKRKRGAIKQLRKPGIEE
jgi:ribosome-associated protein